MNAPEFSRIVRAHEVGLRREQAIEADAAERTALATRFSLLTLDRLTATLAAAREATGIRITGSFAASGAQPCVTSGDPVPFSIAEPVALLLTDAVPGGEDVELAESDLDVEPLTGDEIDFGEIAAQALALALDPWPRAPGASAPGVIDEDAARRLANPFSVLKGGRD